MFRATALFIVLSVTAAPYTTLLCRFSCVPEVSTRIVCEHHSSLSVARAHDCADPVSIAVAVLTSNISTRLDSVLLSTIDHAERLAPADAAIERINSQPHPAGNFSPPPQTNLRV
jgi:hypothetical protein